MHRSCGSQADRVACVAFAPADRSLGGERTYGIFGGCLVNIEIPFPSYVGWWLSKTTPLKNHGVFVSWDDYSIPNIWDDDIPKIWKVIKHVPVTTNQYWI